MHISSIGEMKNKTSVKFRKVPSIKKINQDKLEIARLKRKQKNPILYFNADTAKLYEKIFKHRKK